MAMPFPAASFNLAVMARAPVPGHTKTRLIPRLGRHGAAAFQAACIKNTLDVVAQVEVAKRSLWCSPSANYFQAIWGNDPKFELHTQAEGDLGTRMLNVFQTYCPRGPTLLIGTDCPGLTAEILGDAGRSLDDEHDAVLIPAEDGGYVLIGLHKPVAELFIDIPWGSSRVMRETRVRLRQLGLRWLEFPALWDIDRPADYDRLLLSGVSVSALLEPSQTNIDGQPD